MKLNLIADAGGRSFARALARAYVLGYEDAKDAHRRGKKIYARRTGIDIAKYIASHYRIGHAKHLRSAYGAGVWQYEMGITK